MAERKIETLAEMDAKRRAREEAAGAERARELADLGEVMSTAPGRRLVWRLLGNAGLFRISFAGEQPLAMAFAEGQRNEGLRLFHDLHEACPELYVAMAREAAQASAETQSAAAATQPDA